MILDVENRSVELLRLLETWSTRQPSRISSHGDACCLLSKEWFLAMDDSYSVERMPSQMPSWIRERYKWGPNSWPIYWCQAVSSKQLDCGVLAALTHESLRARRIQALPAQLVKYYGETNCAQWKETWQATGVGCNWISPPFGYHEVCAVLKAGSTTMELWDPTGNYWIDPHQTLGYSTPVAVRIANSNNSGQLLSWGRHQIAPDSWHVLINIFE